MFFFSFFKYLVICLPTGCKERSFRGNESCGEAGRADVLWTSESQQLKQATNFLIVTFIVILGLTFLPFQVKDIYVHPEMFSVANGLLTPTLKSRRTDIRRVFQEQISSMYSKTAI